MIDLCLTGVFRVVKYAGRQMLKQQSGSIILSSTVDALVGCAGPRLLHGRQGRRDGARRARSRRDSRPTASASTRSRRASSRREPQKVWLEDDASRTTIEQLHLLEIPTPEEIAPLVVFLASEESRRMTGTVIPLDSGYMAFKAQPRRDGRDAGQRRRSVAATPRRRCTRRARAARGARCAGPGSRAA